MIDDEGSIQYTNVTDDIVRVETLVARVIPFVRAYPVDVVAICDLDITGILEARRKVKMHGLADALNAELIPVIEETPFPQTVAVGVDLHQSGIGYGQRRKFRQYPPCRRIDQHDALFFRFKAGRIIAAGAALALIVVMLARTHDLRSRFQIADGFPPVETPYRISRPVALLQIKAIQPVALHVSRSSQNIPAGQKFIIEGAEQPFPGVNKIPVHIEQCRTARSTQTRNRRDQRQTVPAFFRLIAHNSRGKNSTAHGLCSFLELTYIRNPPGRAMTTCSPRLLQTHDFIKQRPCQPKKLENTGTAAGRNKVTTVQF